MVLGYSKEQEEVVSFGLGISFGRLTRRERFLRQRASEADRLSDLIRKQGSEKFTMVEYMDVTSVRANPRFMPPITME